MFVLSPTTTEVNTLIRHLLSSERRCRKGEQKKWGSLIYRCDYSSKDDWSKSFSITRHEIEESLKYYWAEYLKFALAMAVKEDNEMLDGAPIDQVRDSATWDRSDEAKAEHNHNDIHYRWSPRYKYCVYADADAISSVVHRAPQPPEGDFDEIGYVNITRLDPWDW